MQRDPDIKEIKEILRELLVNELLPVILGAISSADQNEPNLLSRRDAAKMLGVSVQTIDTLMSEGSIEHVRVRRRVLVPYRALREYMSGGNPKTDSGVRA